jgi:hypothetical protein
MLYTHDNITGEHLVIDGDETIRCATRAEALVLANQRYAAYCAELAKQPANRSSKD